MITFVPIIEEGEEPFSMFWDLKNKYGDWVLDVLTYDSADNLVRLLDSAVVRTAVEKSQQLALKKAQRATSRRIGDYE